MQKYKYMYILILFSAVIVTSSYAVDLKPTPIQDQLTKSILLAADNWELDEKDVNNTSMNNSVVQNKEKKSAFKAALYSAMIPGLGEYYVGEKTKSKIFFATEALTWLSYIAFHTYGDWRKDDMIRLSSDKAGASLSGKSDEFFDWVGFYNSSEEFNSLGRVSDRDRDFLNAPDEYWQWASDADRENFRLYKNSSRTAYKRADFMIVAAIGNRIISIIDAIRDAKRFNRIEKIDISEQTKYNYKFSINPLSSNKQLTVTLFTPF